MSLNTQDIFVFFLPPFILLTLNIHRETQNCCLSSTDLSDLSGLSRKKDTVRLVLTLSSASNLMLINEDCGLFSQQWSAQFEAIQLFSVIYANSTCGMQGNIKQ